MTETVSVCRLEFELNDGWQVGVIQAEHGARLWTAADSGINSPESAVKVEHLVV